MKRPDSKTAPAGASPHDRWIGAGLCALSAFGFGSLSILGKMALNDGMDIASVLSFRFAGAALLLGLYLGLMKRRPLFLGWRTTMALLLLGAVGYAGQSALYFGALARNPAAVNSLLLYIYPAFVALLGWLAFRRRPTGRQGAALALALAGVALTLGAEQLGAFLQPGGLDRLGVVMVIGSALWYAGYILISDRILWRAGAWLSTAWIALGAGMSFGAGGLLSGTLCFAFNARQLALLLAMILLSTIMALGAFLAGMHYVGPTTASLLSTLEPVFTVALAYLLLGERLTAAQGWGGALILGAALLLSLQERPSIHE